jgi:hypothetical protein
MSIYPKMENLKKPEKFCTRFNRPCGQFLIGANSPGHCLWHWRYSGGAGGQSQRKRRPAAGAWVGSLVFISRGYSATLGSKPLGIKKDLGR